jgi:esterase
MNLYFQKFGQGPVLIMLHGLYGSLDNWVSVARKFSPAYTIYLVDLRNHGRSPHSDEHSYSLMAEDIHELITNEGIGKAIILGHSMGGKVAMLYAAAHPDKVAGLIVVDIGPGGYATLNKYSAQVIEHLNIVNTMLSVNLANYHNRADIENEVAKTITDMPIRQFIMKNVERQKDLCFVWKLNVNAISKALPAMMEAIPLGKILGDKQIFEYPVLFIKGEHSHYISAEQQSLITKYFPDAQLKIVPNAKHWVHAEQPGLFMGILEEFLKKCKDV